MWWRKSGGEGGCDKFFSFWQNLRMRALLKANIASKCFSAPGCLPISAIWWPRSKQATENAPRTAAWKKVFKQCGLPPISMASIFSSHLPPDQVSDWCARNMPPMFARQVPCNSRWLSSFPAYYQVNKTLRATRLPEQSLHWPYHNFFTKENLVLLLSCIYDHLWKSNIARKPQKNIPLKERPQNAHQMKNNCQVSFIPPTTFHFL